MKGIALVEFHIPDEDLWNQQWFKEAVKVKLTRDNYIIKVLHLRVECFTDEEGEKG